MLLVFLVLIVLNCFLLIIEKAVVQNNFILRTKVQFLLLLEYMHVVINQVLKQETYSQQKLVISQIILFVFHCII